MRFFKKCLFGLLAMAALSATNAEAESYNLSPWGLVSPKPSALQNQPLMVSVRNVAGDSAHEFTVEVKRQGETVATKTVLLEEPLAKWTNVDVDMDCVVFLPFGEKTDFEVTVTSEFDTNPSDNTKTYSVEMPTTLSYPYEWSDSSAVRRDFYANGKYVGYDTGSGLFRVLASAANWHLGNIRSQAVGFPADCGDVSLRFVYKADTDVTLTLWADYGDGRQQVASKHLEAANQLTSELLTFQPLGTCLLTLTYEGTPASSVNTLYIGQFGLSPASPDLATVAILEPSRSHFLASDQQRQVGARFENKSTFAVVNPVLGYSLNGVSHEGTYQGEIAPGSAIDYFFDEGFTLPEAGDYGLRVYCRANDDNNAVNDSCAMTLTVFKEQLFPYSTSFSPLDGGTLWEAIDGDCDETTWALEDLGELGTAAGIPATSSPGIDYLVSPAIRVPAGRNHVVFDYTLYTLYQPSGLRQLSLLCGPTPNPSEMQKVLFDKKLTNNGWLNAFSLLDLPEEQTLYFAFRAAGYGEEMHVTRFSLDRSEDLCMESVTTDAVSGYCLGETNVSLSLSNHGVSPQKDVKVRFYLNQDSVPQAEETVEGEIFPGETVTHVFSVPADLSVPGTYYVLGEIATPVGDNRANDKILGQVVTCLEPRTIPYINHFTEDAKNAEWTFMNTAGQSSNWFTSFSAMARSGMMVLVHNHPQTAGGIDWAFSEAIRVPAGQYDVEFFFRTNVGMAEDSYRQNFAAFLGTAPSPQAMTLPLDTENGVLVDGYLYRKVTTQVEIPVEGIYYFGFNCTTLSGNGNLFIDDISMTPAREGLPLPFSRDFSEDGSDGDFSRYNPRASDPQWRLTDEGTLSVSRDGEMQASNMGAEGWIVTPKLQLADAGKVKIEVEYSLAGSPANLSLNVFGASRNHPEDFTLLKSLPASAEFTTQEIEVEVPEATPYYIAFRTSAPTELADLQQQRYVYTAALRRLSVAPGEASLDAITLDSASENTRPEYFDLLGRPVINPSSGIYIMRCGFSVRKVRK